MNRWIAGGGFMSAGLLRKWIRGITCLPKPTGCRLLQANRNVNHGLWVIMMCQCWFIDFSKPKAVVVDVDSKGGCACMGAGTIRELSVLSNQFCWQPKNTLKNKVYLVKQNSC